MTSTKNKRDIIADADCMLKTPISVKACVTAMQAMAHFDLQVNVIRESVYSAEVEFVERHNDDLPLYITSRLLAKNDVTCVTFEPNVSLNKGNRISMTQLNPAWLIVFIPLFLFAVNLIDSPDIRFVLLCLLPMMILQSIVPRGGLLTANLGSRSENIEMRTGYIKDLMRQRAEVLQEDLRVTLSVDPLETHHDELGNAYYLDVDNDSAESNTPDKRVR